MKDKYTLQKDLQGEWISMPMNGGDVGDLSEIVEELNMLYGKCQAYQKIIESYERRLDKSESHD